MGGRAPHARGRSAPALAAPELGVTEAAGDVIVHEPAALHEGVADGRAHEAESAALEVLAHRVGFGGGRRNLAQRLAPVLYRRAPDELPDVGVEAAPLALDFEEGAGVRDRRLDLEAVAHDPGILEQRRD